MGFKIGTAPLPREHGAWAMFIVPVAVGLGAAGALNAPALLFALTAFGFFLLRYPLMLAIKSRAPEARATAWRWSALYAALTMAGGLALMALSQLWLLIPLAALGFLSLVIYLFNAARRAEMTTLGEWTGIAGLALGAPGAYLSATGRLDAAALALYLLNLLYFGGTVFYVKFKVREQPRLKPPSDWGARLWAGRVTLGYHLMTIVVVVVMALIGFVPALATIAFFPMGCKAVGGVVNRPVRLNVRRLGFIELGLAVLFTFLVMLAYRL